MIIQLDGEDSVR